MQTHSAQNKQQIRKKIRQQRRNLSLRQRSNAERGLVQSARQCRPLWLAKRVLSYSPFDGELSPEALINALPASAIYYPKIVHYRNADMHFIETAGGSTRNHFGILEPRTVGRPLFANEMDLILTPLIAFDRNGNRIGMGAGYYDRALHALSHQPSTRPLVVGVAHSLQEINRIYADAWDVPLDAILTDTEYIPIASNLNNRNTYANR